jgi:hypothetical protein
MCHKILFIRSVSVMASEYNASSACCFDAPVFVCSCRPVYVIVCLRGCKLDMAFAHPCSLRCGSSQNITIIRS